MNSKASRSGRSPNERRGTSDAPTVVHVGMEPARVVKFDSRRGSGAAILINSGRRVIIPWSALRNAHVATLSPGDSIYVEVDYLDKRRVEAIRLPDS